MGTLKTLNLVVVTGTGIMQDLSALITNSNAAKSCIIPYLSSTYY